MSESFLGNSQLSISNKYKTLLKRKGGDLEILFLVKLLDYLAFRGCFFLCLDVF